MTEYDMAIEALQSTPDFDSTVLQSKSSIPLYYQYRSFGSFWSIIKSESFWATDARFSNDSEEQRFGANIMHHLLGGESGTFPELNEDYIVCFCGEDDKLSQWRGYAAEGGVSIGFDFNAAVPFYVMLKDKEFRADLPKEAYRTVFAQLGHVCYLPPDLPYDLPAEQLPELPPDLPVEQQEDQRYRIFCANEIGCPNDIQKGDSKAVEAFLQELRKRAPFIKHTGFQEENEYRLIFRNEDGQLSECVRYHPVDGNGIQRPYILVRPGNPAYDRKRCVVRLCLKDTGLFHKLWGSSMRN